MRKYYSLSYDKFSKVITTIVLLLIAYVVFFVLPKQKENLYIVKVVFIFIFIGVYIFRPKYYWIDEQWVTIVTKGIKIKIPINEIREVIIIENSQQLKGLRIFGSGGLFGYFGYYYLFKYGMVLAFTSRLNPQILILTEHRKYLISPDDINMADEINNKKLFKTTN